MKETTNLLKEEASRDALVEVDVETLNKIQREVQETLNIARGDPQVEKAIHDLLSLIVKIRVLKASEGASCTKCYDGNLLKLIGEAALLVRLSLAGELPVTHDLKVPVKALTEISLAPLNVKLNIPSRLRPGDLFYVDIHAVPALKLLGICEVVM